MIKLPSEELYYVHYWKTPKFQKNISTGLSQMYLSRLAYLASFIEDDGEPQFPDYRPGKDYVKIYHPSVVGSFMKINNAAAQLWWSEMEKDNLIVKHGNEYAINENYFYIGGMPESVRKMVLAGNAKVCAVPKYLIRELYHSGIEHGGFDLSLFLRILPCVGIDGKLYLPELKKECFTPLTTLQLSQFLHNRKLKTNNPTKKEGQDCQDLIYRMVFITVGASKEKDFLFQFDKYPLGKATLNRVSKIQYSGNLTEILTHNNLISLADRLRLMYDTVIVNPKIYQFKEV